jgi:hypothetical protein
MPLVFIGLSGANLRCDNRDIIVIDGRTCKLVRGQVEQMRRFGYPLVILP